MSQRAEIKADKIMGKPLKPVAIATILCLIFGLGVGVGVAYWNGVGWFTEALNDSRKNPFHELKLSRLAIAVPTNPQMLVSSPVNIATAQAITDGEVERKEPPVTYLSYQPTPAPKRVTYPLSGGLVKSLREVAAARLEQGGIPVPDDFIPDPNNPGRSKPMPPEMTAGSNGFVKLNFEAKPDEKEKGTVIFRVSWEVWRDLYLSRDYAETTSHRMETGSVGPFRVREKDLEAAIIYELEKMIQDQIVTRYRLANPKTRSK